MIHQSFVGFVLILSLIWYWLYFQHLLLFYHLLLLSQYQSVNSTSILFHLRLVSFFLYIFRLSIDQTLPIIILSIISAAFLSIQIPFLSLSISSSIYFILLNSRLCFHIFIHPFGFHSSTPIRILSYSHIIYSNLVLRDYVHDISTLQEIPFYSNVLQFFSKNPYQQSHGNLIMKIVNLQKYLSNVHMMI